MYFLLFRGHGFKSRGALGKAGPIYRIVAQVVPGPGLIWASPNFGLLALARAQIQIGLLHKSFDSWTQSYENLSVYLRYPKKSHLIG